MTDVLDRLRAADPAVASVGSSTKAQLQAWCDAGLRRSCPGCARPADVRPGVTTVPRRVEGGAGVPGQRVLSLVLAEGPPGLLRSVAFAGTDLGLLAPWRRVSGGRRWWVPAAGVAAAGPARGHRGAAGLAPPLRSPRRRRCCTTRRSRRPARARRTRSPPGRLSTTTAARRDPRPGLHRAGGGEWSLSTRVDGEQVTSAVVPVQVALTRRATARRRLVRRTAAPEFRTGQSRERWGDAGHPAARPVDGGAPAVGPRRFAPRRLPCRTTRPGCCLSWRRSHPIAEAG